jgi:hypothetical protein
MAEVSTNPRMAKFRHVCPVLGRNKALTSLGLPTDFAGVSAGIAGSTLIAPATPPTRGVIGTAGVPEEKRRSFFVEGAQLCNHGTRAMWWTPRASILIATRGPLRLAPRAVA